MKFILGMVLYVNLFAYSINPFVGVTGSLSNNHLDAEEPIGTYGIKLDNNHNTYYYRHISSVPQTDEDNGINMLGYEYTIYKYGLYYNVGLAYRSNDIDGQYYSDRLGNWLLISGVSLKYTVGDIFIKSYSTEKQDFIIYGVEFIFSSDKLLRK